MKIELKEARRIGEEFLKLIDNSIVKGEICGSIRREKDLVHDIDLVVLPQNQFTFAGDLLIKLPTPSKIIKQGNKLIQIKYQDVQVDIYLANKINYEVIKLIRTGSANHNVKLCSIAKRKGWHLYANGKGLYDGDDLITNTESGILIKLLGKDVPPKERN